jgi:hypothetical protein
VAFGTLGRSLWGHWGVLGAPWGDIGRPKGDLGEHLGAQVGFWHAFGVVGAIRPA